MPFPFGLGQQMACRAPEFVEQDARRGFGDAAALAALDFEEPHLLQGIERFANGGTANSKPHHELAFGRKLVTRLVLGRQNHLFKARQHLIGQPPAANDLCLHEPLPKAPCQLV